MGLRRQIGWILGCIATVCIGGSPLHAAVETRDWGIGPSGQKVSLYTLQNAKLRVRLTNYGARIVSLEAPDRLGRVADIVLGHDSLAPYLAEPKGYFGATVGRYANRLAGGMFTLDGVIFHVPLNANGNALHGGPMGFSSKVWVGSVSGQQSVEFTLVSPAGEMGFPGNLTVHVRYTLEGESLRMDYAASTAQATVVNLTNHTYFNLAGESSGNVLAQEVSIDADRFTPVNERAIPTGELRLVNGTPFDFRKATPIGSRLGVQEEQLKRAGGYDHNFVLNGISGRLRRAATAIDPASGRTLTILTTEPGLQFYSGNFLDGSAIGYSGKRYDKYAGFCMEAQHFPDSPNHPQFPSTTLLPGAIFRSSTIWIFGVSK